MLSETVSPCILWIDEMEKAFAGAGVGSINAGAATRVFGTFLTWMQEHRTPVYVLATANDIGSLPAELLGRFDRTYFLDLPNDIERQAIFKIHLSRAGENVPIPVAAVSRPGVPHSARPTASSSDAAVARRVGTSSQYSWSQKTSCFGTGPKPSILPLCVSPTKSSRLLKNIKNWV